MVKKFLDLKIRSRNFRVQNRANCNKNASAKQKQRDIRQRREGREIVTNGKQKASVPRKNLADSATTKAKLEKRRH